MKRSMIVGICLVCGLFCQAQTSSLSSTNTPARFLVSANFQLAQPLNHFSSNLNTQAYGGSASVFVLIYPDLPIYAGLELSGLMYDQAYIQFVDEIDGFLVQLREETTPSIFMGHAVVRVEPPVNFFAFPYLEGLVGFKNLYTRTKVKDTEVSEDAVLSNIVEEGDWAFSYGLSLGVSIPIGNNLPTIDLKCAYLIGNAANYLVRRKDIAGIPARPIDIFELKNSTTDLLLPQIGITFAFGK